MSGSAATVRFPRRRICDFGDPESSTSIAGHKNISTAEINKKPIMNSQDDGSIRPFSAARFLLSTEMLSAARPIIRNVDRKGIKHENF
jgi:hypothetical protein